MNLIASVFSAFMAPLFAWIVTIFSRKYAVIILSFATFALVTTAFIVSIQYFLTTLLNSAVMPEWIAYGVGIFLPYNFVTVISLILGAYVSRWSYDLAIKKIEIINTAT